ncbi:hypothetical protein P7C71_g2928, partial [Lecanoromycetidae sp. Uapishka_2]
MGLLMDHIEEAYSKNPYKIKDYFRKELCDEPLKGQVDRVMFEAIKADGNRLNDIYVCVFFYKRLADHAGAGDWGDKEAEIVAQNLARILKKHLNLPKFHHVTGEKVLDIFAYTWLWDDDIANKWAVIAGQDGEQPCEKSPEMVEREREMDTIFNKYIDLYKNLSNK